MLESRAIGIGIAAVRAAEMIGDQFAVPAVDGVAVGLGGGPKGGAYLTHCL